jgi:asparagine synthase (glutamine-hydrolysing)
MCGIFFFLNKKENLTANQIEILKVYADKNENRGPDNKKYIFEKNYFFGFYRLAINDLSEAGNQPFLFYDSDSSVSLDINSAHNNRYILICNGEIYNHNQLKEKYNIETQSHSDCEVILPLIKKIGIEKTCDELDGVFAFVCLDKETGMIWAGRDTIGVRPMFYYENNAIICFSSVYKAMEVFAPNAQQFPTGSYYENGKISKFIDIISLVSKPQLLSSDDEQYLMENVRNDLISAVRKRLMSDRDIGCMLSGGLDSSLIAGIVNREMKRISPNKRLRTYSIGFEGSPDLMYARKVADFLESEHHEVLMTMDEALNVLPQIVCTIESYDITTIRASTGMYLLSKYIRKLNKDVVIFSGEGSDELCQGYLYFHAAPSPFEGQLESMRLLKDLHLFDVLRGDRTTASWGLEIRVPFLDKNFMRTYLSIHPKYTVPRNGVEKYLLRKSFDGENYIPGEILWRKKEAFSDGISQETMSWHKIIQNFVNGKISDDEYNTMGNLFIINKPISKESYYFRKIFDSYYPDGQHLTQYYWLPKWIDCKDPSARNLKIYKELDEKTNNE